MVAGRDDVVVLPVDLATLLLTLAAISGERKPLWVPNLALYRDWLDLRRWRLGTRQDLRRSLKFGYNSSLHATSTLRQPSPPRDS